MGGASFRVAGFVAVALAAATARAHSGGQPGGVCTGCHSAGDYDIVVSAQPSSVSPGESITVTVTITSPTGAGAGMFVSADAGALDPIPGEGLGEVTAGLTHTMPKSIENGSVEFSFAWHAPDSPGAVRFSLWTLVANLNGASSGDMANDAVFDVVFGCEGQQYFLDSDGDDYGRTEEPLLHCADATPEGHAVASGDCNDLDPGVHPGAVEYCNARDDDCDVEVDEDAVPLDLYPDGDADGYYGLEEYASGDSIVGCVGTEGYAGFGGDCEPFDAAINPGAEDICNLLDDNCDGRVDEFVRPRCGEGWCRREAPTCDAATCVPGEPMPETCNLLDDDCDAMLDEDAGVCAADLACVLGECVDPNAATSTAGNDSTASGDASSSSSTSGASEDEATKGCVFVPTRDRPTSLGWLALLLVVRKRRPSAP